ncbi:MAG: hypothetical protein NXH75_01690 [Halobacteriovoraceae bacterium]|nr:hypothetical protein [Halobacteriovoraceae bacterium]
MRFLLLAFFLLPSASAGGTDPMAIFKALENLSEKSIITNYFLSHPDSKMCGKGRSFSGLGQKLAMATEDFKAVWVSFNPSSKQLSKLKEWNRTCGPRDDCFSLRTLVDLNPKLYSDFSIKSSDVDYSKEIKKIKKVCQKLD